MRDQFFEFLHRSGSLEMKETAAAVRGDSVAENFQKGLLRRGKKLLKTYSIAFSPPLKTQRNQCPHFHPLLLPHNHNLFSLSRPRKHLSKKFPPLTTSIGGGRSSLKSFLFLR